MNVKGKTKIFRREFNGRVAYSRSISSQEYKDGQKGDWIRAYEPVQFPKGADIADGTMVEVEGFEAVFKNKDGEIRRKLVVQNYKVEGSNDIEPAFYGSENDMPY